MKTEKRPPYVVERGNPKRPFAVILPMGKFDWTYYGHYATREAAEKAIAKILTWDCYKTTQRP